MYLTHVEIASKIICNFSVVTKIKKNVFVCVCLCLCII